MAKQGKRKFAVLNIRKITGGKDPVFLMEEFISRHDFEPEKCLQHKTAENARWMLPISNREELEILLEGLRNPGDTTVYMGLNVITVPVRGAADLLAAALQIADGLIGVKVSLVGHYLVVSASFPAAGLSVDDLEYYFSMITAQQKWFREMLLQELDWEAIPEE